MGFNVGRILAEISCRFHFGNSPKQKRKVYIVVALPKNKRKGKPNLKPNKAKRDVMVVSPRYKA